MVVSHPPTTAKLERKRVLPSEIVQSATAEQLTRQLAVVVSANNQLEQQLLQLEVQRSADRQRIQWLERLLVSSNEVCH